jgi:hypothetical protein
MKALGLSSLPNDVSPVVDIAYENQKVWKRGQGGNKSISLSGGQTLESKDLLKSVSYQDGKYFLNYDKFLGHNEFAKMLTGSGGRFTTNTNNILTSGEFNAIAKSVGLENMGIGAFVEGTKDDPRKLAAQTGETWEGLF